MSDYERRQAAALASTAGAVPQADGDPGPDEGWDLLLDYDRDHDVPGQLGVTLNAYTALGEPIRCVEIHDGPPDPERVRHIHAARLQRAGFSITGWSWSNSTNGWHVKIRLAPQPESPLETVALQALLGSDPLRESCNVQRAREVDAWERHYAGDDTPAGQAAIQFWRDRWNVLYRPNPNRKKVRK